MNLNGSQIHLLLNHVPVIGSLGILLILLAAVIRKREEYTRLALGFALLVAVITIPVLRSGEPAEQRIEHMPGVTEHWISRHEDMGKLALGAALLFGAVAALALGSARGGKPLARWVTPAALVLALVTSGLMAVTAHRGGMVRHTELRPGFVPPADGVAGETPAVRADSSATGTGAEPGEAAEKETEEPREHH
jgi:hypothetical protein